MAVEERTLAPKEGRWIAKPSKPRWFLPALAPIFVSQIFNFVNLLGGARHPEAYLLLAFSIPLLVILAVAIPYAIAARRRVPQGELNLPDGVFGDQFEADVTIVVDRKRLGTDRGIVWFSEGLIGFSGHASSFVLDADDIAPQSIPSLRVPSKYTVPIDALVLKGAPKNAYVVVTALKGRATAYRQRLKRFVLPEGSSEDERLVRYVTRNQNRSEERQWPPLEPYVPEPRSIEQAVRR